MTRLCNRRHAWGRMNQMSLGSGRGRRHLGGRRGPCVLQGENLIYQNLTILTYQNNRNLEFKYIQKLQTFRNMYKFSKL